MSNSNVPAPADAAQIHARRLAAAHLQLIEGNPLDAEQTAMFEMFEREAWPHNKRRAYILARIRASAAE